MGANLEKEKIARSVLLFLGFLGIALGIDQSTARVAVAISPTREQIPLTLMLANTGPDPNRPTIPWNLQRDRGYISETAKQMAEIGETMMALGISPEIVQRKIGGTAVVRMTGLTQPLYDDGFIELPSIGEPHADHEYGHAIARFGITDAVTGEIKSVGLTEAFAEAIAQENRARHGQPLAIAPANDAGYPYEDGADIFLATARQFDRVAKQMHPPLGKTLFQVLAEEYDHWERQSPKNLHGYMSLGELEFRLKVLYRGANQQLLKDPLLANPID